MYGHSFGAVTTGRVLATDARVKAGLTHAAAPDASIWPEPYIQLITQPLFMILAREDNMVLAFGCQQIIDNFDAKNGRAWKLEVDDAGHMTFSDLCWITPNYRACCGEGKRQTDPSQTFTYLDQQTGLAIAEAYAAAFFSATLLDDAAALDYLGAQNFPGTEMAVKE